MSPRSHKQPETKRLQMQPPLLAPPHRMPKVQSDPEGQTSHRKVLGAGSGVQSWSWGQGTDCATTSYDVLVLGCVRSAGNATQNKPHNLLALVSLILMWGRKKKIANKANHAMSR